MSHAGIVLSQEPRRRAKVEFGTQGVCVSLKAPWLPFSKHLFPVASCPPSGWGWELVFPLCNRWSLCWVGGGGL